MLDLLFHLHICKCYLFCLDNSFIAVLLLREFQPLWYGVKTIRVVQNLILASSCRFRIDLKDSISTLT